ncbi:MAG: hypothetical protein HFI96_06370 [Lachnospiraceae bacterium]|nr:hypothetical protein [Lachnospiraceae bacterium]
MSMYKELADEKIKNIQEYIQEIVYEEKKELPIILKRAYTLASYFLLKRIKIEEGEIIVGQRHREYVSDNYPLSIDEEIEYMRSNSTENELDWGNIISGERMKLFNRSPGGHVVPGYETIMNEGLDCVIEKIRRLKKGFGPEDREYYFYEAEIILAKAASECILRYTQEAEKLKDNNMRERIIETCEWVAHNKPRSFYEAVQLLWFLHEFCLEDASGCVISVGRIDQILFPYYDHDLKTGKIDEKEAYTIILALWRKFALNDHGFQNIALGGGDAFGRDMSNDLTRMCMDASIESHTEQPALILRIHEATPDHIWEKAFELIQTGIGMPALFNDNVAIQAKRNVGIARQDACNYSVVGCVELTIGGKEYSHTEGLRINWLKILELMLFKGVCPITQNRWKLKEEHDLKEFEKFEDFYEWYKTELLYVVEQVCEYVQMEAEEYGKHWPSPFISLLMEGCLENGKDVTEGGTVYNNLSINNAGMANVADSLEAIENLVFKEGIVTLDKIPEILESDFAGYPNIKEKVMSYPKFGNDLESVDKKLSDLINLVCGFLKKKTCNRKGGNFQPGFYTVEVHGMMGAVTGASIDGRERGAALANSLSPSQGSEKNGPTAVINSLNKIKMEEFGNGMVLDMKFTPDFMKKKNHIEAIKNLVKVYFKRGGMEVQFNVIDKETLIDAQKDPGKYYDLIVRVSGYSAYFVTLDRILQEEIINRMEYKKI